MNNPQPTPSPMEVTKGKYTILEYPTLGIPNLHTVKVLKVYDNPKHGRIVQYRYNWPFPITKEVEEAEFKQWIAIPAELQQLESEE